MLLPIQGTHDVHFTKEKETLLITLYAKALDYRSKRPILGDKAADELVRSIDYDFAKFKTFDNDNITVMRAKQYDDWIREFIGKHPQGMILYLGCGLDTRVVRIDPPPEISWYDLDYPEVIAFRRRFIAERPGYVMLTSSITSPGWLEDLPRDRPVMIVAEGVLEYLQEGEVEILLNRLTSHFEHGEIAFDVLNSFAVRSGRRELEGKTGAAHTWAVDDTSTIDRMDPHLRKTAELSVFALPSVRQLPLAFRVAFTAARMYPKTRNILRLLRYQF